MDANGSADILWSTMIETQQWTTGDIPDLDGLTVIITGANSGVGYETAIELARHGANITLACRSESRGESALRRIKSDSPSATVELAQLDLGDLGSVDRFVQQVCATQDKLDLLINNAGVMATPYRTTASGFEAQFGTNHLGHFALTGRLMSLLIKSTASRIVNVSSLAHRGESIDLQAIQFTRESYNRWRAYGRSKLANLLFTYELHRRFERAGIGHISSLAAHPGVSKTNIAQGLGWIGKISMPIAGLFFQSARMGALPILRAATDPNAASGEYYGPDRPNERKGYPVIVTSSDESHDVEVARRLWEQSEKLTGVRFEI